MKTDSLKQKIAIMKPVPWFTRKFNCPADLEALPCILERLAGTPARLEEKLNNIPTILLAHVWEEGKWTIQEHAGHLLDLEWLWFARIEDFSKGVEVLTAADLSNRKTYEANHNARPIQDILFEFRKERTRAVKAIAGMPEGAFSHTSLHPRLKTPMRFADFAFFVAEHDDHHLAMISYLSSKK